MRGPFEELAGRLERELRAGEVLLSNFHGERSDFVRFNRGRVRQAGSVEQRSLALRLVRDRRQASASLTLAGGGDLERAKAALERLREALERLPEDPWLAYNDAPHSTESVRRGRLPDATEVVEQAIAAAGAHDFVGFYAGGPIHRGFASSLGQRNWHEVDSFNFDWSLHGAPGRAVKRAYAGFDWEPQALERGVETGAQELRLLDRPPKELAPGEYRAYLAPRALEELAGMLAWGGFSARARATRQSPLLRMQEGARLSPKVTMRENTAEGLAPGFQAEGFLKPPSLTLIEAGRLGEALVSPRSAKEFGLAPNGAGGGEAPESLDMAGGALEESEALAALERGLCIGNLWYLNYSDRPAARITGMTRFATFWVEAGRLAAPVAAMRFDDSLYRLLGENLVELTRGRELALDASTYGERSTASARLPGALVKAIRLTL